MAVMDSTRADASEVSLITVSQRLHGVKGQQASLMRRTFGQLIYCLREGTYIFPMPQQFMEAVNHF